MTKKRHGQRSRQTALYNMTLKSRSVSLLFLLIVVLPIACQPPTKGGDADGEILEDAGFSQFEDAGEESDSGAMQTGPTDAGSDLEQDAGSGFAASVYTGTYYRYIRSDIDEQALLLALNSLLSSTHERVSYDDLNAAYLTTDVEREGCDGIFDFYTDKCWGTDVELRCGNTNGLVGRCWNKEHSWPKSWWGGRTNDAYSDLFHVIPSDGQANNRRGNLPYGEVDNPTFGGRSVNGVFVASKMGPCITAGAGGNCFEPADDMKGDLARGYFYMATRYEGELSDSDSPAVSGADIESWQEDLLRDWHLLDPPDDAERTRNDLVFSLQGNRNPYIDHPEWILLISDF